MESLPEVHIRAELRKVGGDRKKFGVRGNKARKTQTTRARIFKHKRSQNLLRISGGRDHVPDSGRTEGRIESNEGHRNKGKGNSIEVTPLV